MELASVGSPSESGDSPNVIKVGVAAQDGQGMPVLFVNAFEFIADDFSDAFGFGVQVTERAEVFHPRFGWRVSRRREL